MKYSPAESAVSDKPNRRWYQFGFSIRDLLFVTVIVALALGWLRHTAELRTENASRQGAKLAKGRRRISNNARQLLTVDWNTGIREGNAAQGGFR